PESRSKDAPQPQPEPTEQRLADPGLGQLSRRDYVAVAKRAVRESLDDQITDAAAALAYYAFLALPALLLLAVGLFSLFAGEDAIDTMMDKLGEVAPAETVRVLDRSLKQVTQNQGGGVAMIAVGTAVALWTATGAMAALIRALNTAYDRKETRGYVRQRLTALAMLAFAFVAFLLSFGLLVLGPHLSGWLGSLLGSESAFKTIWWAAQWPILVVGLLVTFAGILFLGPNVDHPRWQFLTLGSLIAVVIWLAASGLFAVYVSMFGSYNKTWGSLAAVIVMLTWLWLSGLALLFGAEVNAEAERSRELRRGEPAEREIQAPAKG
ncbi:MAG: YihY/virulence factor BrkB family protein, partial [Actinomycetota bacterium]|nr:YihY/virulence factor BrkB family protein [Actinomycetota bacterium]